MLESEGKNSEDRVLGPRYLDKWDDAVSRVLCHLEKLLQPVCGVNVIIVEGREFVEKYKEKKRGGSKDIVISKKMWR